MRLKIIINVPMYERVLVYLLVICSFISLYCYYISDNNNILGGQDMNLKLTSKLERLKKK